MEILRFDELRNANNSLELEGGDHGGAGVSFFLVDAAPGRGPLLHRHDYVEVFTVLEGQAAGEAHGFTATGEGSRQLNIHSSPRFVTEWLEQEAYG